ncbi:MAG: hypothetical protein U0J83_02965, partial [Bulleidia sp.]|nr:hypothetical protein [Bulleidia sp.]
NKKIPEPNKARKKIQSQCEATVLQDTFILCGIVEISSAIKVKQNGRKYNLYCRDIFVMPEIVRKISKSQKPGIAI